MDAVAEARRPLPPPRRAAAPVPVSNATILEREDLTPSMVRLRIRPDDGLPAFEPGQYFALGIEVDGRPLQRPYSTSSPRGETVGLEFLVRLVPGGELTPRLWALGSGARVRIGRPKGLFVPDRDDSRRPVYVATGTGIAPLVSMLESRLVEQPGGSAGRRPIVVHGVARAAELAHRERLEVLAAEGRIAYVPAVSRPDDPANARWRGASGRIDSLVAGILVAHGAAPDETVAFVCGNPGMVDAVTARLRGYGMPLGAVLSEAYWVQAPAG